MVEIQDTRFWQFELLKKVLCFRLLLQNELETDSGSQWRCHSENYLKGTVHCYQVGAGTSLRLVAPCVERYGMKEVSNRKRQKGWECCNRDVNSNHGTHGLKDGLEFL